MPSLSFIVATGVIIICHAVPPEHKTSLSEVLRTDVAQVLGFLGVFL